MKNIHFFLFCLFFSLSFFACKKTVEIEYTISPASLNFKASGGQAEFTVDIKFPAIVESIGVLDTTWCRINTIGTSPMRVIVIVAPNTKGRERNTSVILNLTLDETRISTTVPISQEAAYIGEWILIHGVKWALCNVELPGKFAAHPEDAGMFYQWNRKIGWSAADTMLNSNGGTTWPDFGAIGETWEKENDPCPVGWRVPTTAEQHSLASASNEWTTLNGVDGRMFGTEEPRLFLPAAGNRHYNNGALGNVGTHGYYWSRSINDANVFYLYFFNTDVRANIVANRAYGFSVRCVAE